MSLIHFHRFLIVCGILFCLGYAGWEVRAFLRTGSTSALLLVAAFTALGILLATYLWHLSLWLGREDVGPREGTDASSS